MITIKAGDGSARVPPIVAARISLDEDAPRYKAISVNHWISTLADRAECSWSHRVYHTIHFKNSTGSDEKGMWLGGHLEDNFASRANAQLLILNVIADLSVYLASKQPFWCTQPVSTF